MNNYTVERRDTGEVVYAYGADQATEWPEYPYSEFNHIIQKADANNVKRRITKLDFVIRLGDDYITLLSASKQSVEVEAFMKMLDWATPDPDGTSIDLDDARLTGALGRLEQSGLIAAGRATEITS